MSVSLVNGLIKSSHDVISKKQALRSEKKSRIPTRRELRLNRCLVAGLFLRSYYTFKGHILSAIGSSKAKNTSKKADRLYRDAFRARVTMRDLAKVSLDSIKIIINPETKG